MKNNSIKLTLYLVLFAVFIIIAVILYENMAEDYSYGTPGISENSENKTMAPDFKVYDKNREVVSLSSYKGKPVVVNFWATWCGFCVKEFPAFENAYKKYGDKVEFMMVNLTDKQSETIEKAEAFINGKKYTFPVFYDKDFSAAMSYNTTSIPITVFIDAEGKLVYKRIGSMTEDMLVEYIELLIGE